MHHAGTLDGLEITLGFAGPSKEQACEACPAWSRGGIDNLGLDLARSKQAAPQMLLSPTCESARTSIRTIVDQHSHDYISCAVLTAEGTL